MDKKPFAGVFPYLVSPVDAEGKVKDAVLAAALGDTDPTTHRKENTTGCQEFPCRDSHRPEKGRENGVLTISLKILPHPFQGPLGKDFH